MPRFSVGWLSLLVLFLLPGASAEESLELEDCRISAGPGFPSIKARCGTLPRHLNPADESAGESSITIDIRVVIVPALDLTPAPDPFVPIAGGPGQGSVEFYASYANAFEAVRWNRDILLVDQRGTGESARLDCPVDDDLITGDFSIEQTRELTRSCLDALEYDPRYFTTSVAVADLEAVRIALGYPELNLYGISYGSRVAQHFVRRHPESTRTMVLDGVVAPQIALGPEIATLAQDALDDILNRCVENDACNERFPDVGNDFVTLKALLEDAPVAVRMQNPLTGRYETIDFGRNELATAIRLLAYHSSTMAIVPLLIDEAANGNFEPIAAQFLMTANALMDSLAMGMHNSVVCTEDMPYIDPDTIDRERLEASYIGSFQLDALEAICSEWPRGPIDDDFNDALTSDIPTLLLSGSADPITPPSYAELAIANLTRATHLIGERQGHGQAAIGCVPELISDFVTSADPTELDATCMERSFSMPFFLDFAGPLP